MKILAIESSSLTASAAVLENGIIKSVFTINNRLTHSETLLPMIREAGKISGLELSDCDAIAVSSGPGSFTGLRIGAATAKGLALAWQKPIIKVPTLKAMALNVISYGSPVSDPYTGAASTDINANVCAGADDTDTNCHESNAPAGAFMRRDTVTSKAEVICPIMDARRGQIYGAAYINDLSAVIPDGAYDINEFLTELLSKAPESSFIFLGDGVPVHRQTVSEKLKDRVHFALPHVSMQNASSVALLGEYIYKNEPERVVDSDDFVPEYFRKTQAEREMADGLLEDPGKHSLGKLKNEGRHPRRNQTCHDKRSDSSEGI